MAIPDFQSIMLPLLKLLDDQKTRSSLEIRTVLADTFDLTEEERKELLPSGTQLKFTNRVAWAISYLYRAKILDRPKRSYYRITQRGLDVLEQNPPKIDLAFLSQYPEVLKFRTKKKTKKEDEPGTPSAETPQESLENAYEVLRRQLVAEILEQIQGCSPAFFEQLVVRLLVKMGYGGSIQDAGQAIGKGGDEGVDGIIKEDRLGLDVIYLQAKKWEGTVGRPEIQKFVGALHGKHAKKGVFLTTSYFSKEAWEYAKNIDPKVVLIDGEMLAELMIDVDLGVSPHAMYEIKKLDSDFFTDE